MSLRLAKLCFASLPGSVEGSMFKVVVMGEMVVLVASVEVGKAKVPTLAVLKRISRKTWIPLRSIFFVESFTHLTIQISSLFL